MGLFRRNKTKNQKQPASPEVAALPEQPMNTNASEAYIPIIPKGQAVELGTINYVNLTSDGRHGEFDTAVRIARETGRPVFANFVEWSG